MSTLIAPGEVVDCSNPKLDLYTTVNGSLANAAVVEFAIFDIDNPGVPVQTYPVSGYQAIDPLNDCPTGQRLSTGRYTALWTVDAGEALTNHKISWRFKMSASDPVYAEVEQPFNVVAISGGADPVDVTAFRLRFPSFSDPNQFPTTLISEALSEAMEDLCESCFGATKIERARNYYAAHLLSFVTSATRAGGASSVTAGPSSISWDTARSDMGATSYGAHYLIMVRRCTGMQVI